MQQSAVGDLRNWVRLVQSEFVEMPELRLSIPQAQRLWNLDARSTHEIFDALEASHFLKRTPEDIFGKADINR